MISLVYRYLIWRTSLVLLGLSLGLFYYICNFKLLPTNLPVVEEREVIAAKSSEKIGTLISFFNFFDQTLGQDFNLISLEGSFKQVKLTGETFTFLHLEKIVERISKYYPVNLSQIQGSSPYRFQLTIFL